MDVLSESDCPPGDILLRAYFAGVWENNGSTLLNQLLVSYSNLSVREWIKGRMINLSCLLPMINIENNLWNNIWNNKWSSLSAMLGVDLVLLLLGILSKKGKEQWRKPKIIYFVKVFVATIILQSIMYYTPGDTIIHQCTYSNIILAFVICTLVIKCSKNWIKYVLIIINIFEIIPALAINPMMLIDYMEYAEIFYRTNYFAVALMIMFGTFLIFSVLKDDRQDIGIKNIYAGRWKNCIKLLNKREIK